MRRIAFWFFATAAVYGALSIAWLAFAASQGQSTLAPLQANLFSWPTMALFGLYYHLVPSSRDHLLAKLHFLVATLGLLALAPGMAIADQAGPGSAGLLIVGATLTVGSMLMFIFTVWRDYGATSTRYRY